MWTWTKRFLLTADQVKWFFFLVVFFIGYYYCQPLVFHKKKFYGLCYSKEKSSFPIQVRLSSYRWAFLHNNYLEIPLFAYLLLFLFSTLIFIMDSSQEKVSQRGNYGNWLDLVGCLFRKIAMLSKAFLIPPWQIKCGRVVCFFTVHSRI